MQLGIVGKPNVGKSTFFNASTDAHAEIANYPFTTIDANKGVMYIRKPCPCKDFELSCTPRNSECHDGTRFVPIEAIDVAGLVPDAHKGKGLGNKFLDDLRQAHALIHIIDASGSTDAEGNPCEAGSHDPLEDIGFLDVEIQFWINGIIEKNWDRITRMARMESEKIESLLAEQLTGLGIREEHVKLAMRRAELRSDGVGSWGNDELLNLSSELVSISKPMILAFNKADKASDEMLAKMEKVPGERLAIATSAESELALSHAAEKNLIKYVPGSDGFSVLDGASLSEKQKQALDYIDAHVLKRFGGTGIQRCIDEAVSLLDLIVVYPVEDDHKLTDKEGRVLPDAHLVARGTTAKELAFIVHTDLGNNFIRAIDCRTKRVVGADHVLQDGDVISIIANA